MRKQYSQEYKTSAVKMVLEEGKAATDVAQNLGISVSLLHKWIRHHKGVDTKGKTNDFQAENKQLKHENQELKKQLATSEMYREILKKATAYFAAQTL